MEEDALVHLGDPEQSQTSSAPQSLDVAEGDHLPLDGRQRFDRGPDSGARLLREQPLLRNGVRARDAGEAQ